MDLITIIKSTLVPKVLKTILPARTNPQKQTDNKRITQCYFMAQLSENST